MNAHVRVATLRILLIACLLAFAPTSYAQTTATLTVLHNFTGNPDGYKPRGPLVLVGSYFCGLTSYGGANSGDGGDGYGTIYRIDPSGAETVLHSFDGSDGFDPYLSGMIVVQDGSLYGVTSYGGANNDGALFQVTTGGSFTLLHSFNGTDGSNPCPAPGLLQTADGSLYGTTTFGGANGDGTVFRATTSGAITTLHSFSGADGAEPESSLTLGNDGNLYGVTIVGGASNEGTIYQITTAGVLTTLYSFTNGNDGGVPVNALTLGRDGNFYGTTKSGGVNGQGVFYQFTPPATLTVLHSFTGPDGAQAYGQPVQGPDGNFYGTTIVGGTNNTGTIYQIAPTGAFTTLHSFGADNGQGDNADGETPSASPVFGTDGNLYGTAQAGGPKANGTVYKLVVHPGGTLQFSGAAYNVNEDAGSATIIVTRAIHSAGGVTIQYATADGSAKAGTDYQSVSGTLSWGDGDLSPRTFIVPITDRGLFDGSTRTLSLLLSSPTGGADPGNPTTATLTITENDPPPPAPVITSNAPPGGQVGAAYSFQITATNGATSFAANGLPPGLNLNAATGLINGTPTQAGTFSVTFSAANAGGMASAGYSLTILPAVPVILSAASASGQVGQPFVYQIAASNAPTMFNAAGLPAGLNINTASGLITGGPTVQGMFPVTLSATNTGGTGTLAITLSFTFTPSLAPAITSVTSTTATVGAPFSFALTATNVPTSYAAVGLPPGLSLDATNGLISGTPTTAGTYTASISATNASGTGTAALTFTVAVAPADVSGIFILSPPADKNIVLGETIDLEVAIGFLPGTLANVTLDAYNAPGTAPSDINLGNGQQVARFGGTWQPPALGDYFLRATTTDTTGATAVYQIPIHVITSSAAAPNSDLLSALDNKYFAAGTTLPLLGMATDSGGNAITNAQFYADGTQLTTASVSIASSASSAVVHRQDAAASPFSKSEFAMGNLIKDALLTLVATDSNQVSKVSKGATIHITAAPSNSRTLACAVASPATSGQISANTATTATVTASETGGSVSQVELFVDLQSVGVATAAPYSFTVPGLTAGSHALTALATDANNISVASEAVVVSVAAPAPPVVTVTASATVEEGAKGKIVFQRSGDTSQAITVRYKLVGDAQAGIDYKSPGNTVMIPAGQMQAKVKLKTLDNATADGTLVVKIKLLPVTDGSYTLGSQTTAKIKIIDND